MARSVNVTCRNQHRLGCFNLEQCLPELRNRLVAFARFFRQSLLEKLLQEGEMLGKLWRRAGRVHRQGLQSRLSLKWRLPAQTFVEDTTQRVYLGANIIGST